MGHLINPTALRLGWTLQWNDVWYAPKAYYPEYLYFVYKVKLFLTYFFSKRFIEKCGYFYSHFDVIQKYNTIFINTYFYDGKVEDLMTHLFTDHLETWKSFKNRGPKKKRKLRNFRGFRYLVILHCYTLIMFAEILSMHGCLE